MDLDALQIVIGVVTAIVGVLGTIGVFVLALQKQRTERPLVEAQTEASSMAGIKSSVEVMGMAHNLTIAQQNTEMEKLRGDMERQKNAHEQAIAVMRAEMETKLASQTLASDERIRKLEGQLTDANTTIDTLTQSFAAANTTIGTLTKRITDLEALLIVANKETAKAEAKQESAEAATPLEPTVPLPFPVTIVPPEPSPTRTPAEAAQDAADSGETKEESP